MRNIYSNIIEMNRKSLTKIKKILVSSQLIALPTETVYGLAGNAYSNSAVKKIYKIKRRPKKNPLILHYYDLSLAGNDFHFDETFLKLYKKFCPGPITFIVKRKKNSRISSYAYSKLDTVAVRFPKHKKIRILLKKLKFPLAMPSANLSGSVSPTSPKDVIDEFKNRIKVVNGGRSGIGVESTVIDITGKIKILRPGAVNLIDINRIIRKKISISRGAKIIKSPGNLGKHYSPGIPIVLNVKKRLSGCAFIVLGKIRKNDKDTFSLSLNANLNEAAKNLYKTLRKIKKLNYKKICVMKIPNKRLGIAINDRLKRAAKK
tara:strand:- start:1439 stop:2392 length:954 start_codon:yes stop_codon:yes gene_type:complete